MRAVLGLGSNLGDRWSQLSDAIDALIAGDPGAVVSPIYETAPVGGPRGQGPYLNCVVSIETALAPLQLLAMCQALEAAAKRVRAERFGPRTLDVDVLVIEGYTSDAPELTVPHPRMASRAFVLAPLSDIAPELVDADWREALGGEDAVRAAVREVGAYVRDLPASP